MNRRGFTLLEATIAMAIVGLVAVVALGEFASEIRTGTRAAEARVLQALVQDRISALQVAPPDLIVRVPDSLKAGTFPPPFSEYQWTLSIRPERELDGLLQARVAVSSKTNELTVATRLYRPLPRGEPPRP